MKLPTLHWRRLGWAAWTARPLLWLGLAVAFLTVDFFAGPDIQFPVAFIFPVALAAWHRGLGWGLGLAIGQPLVRFSFNFFWEPPWSIPDTVANTLIRAAVLCAFAWLVAHTARQSHHIAALERLLPVCAWCRRIRDEQGGWQALDSYLSERAGLAVTHGICPECMRQQVANSRSSQAASPG
jgi:hypothetical protein